jgi:transcriptional regulator of acetoin/glycerol metabolism
MDALNRTGGNKAKAARELGIDRRTLYRNLERK